MAVLECVKSGAKFGQIILVVDLTVAVDRTLAKIKDLGDHSEIRHTAETAVMRYTHLSFNPPRDTQACPSSCQLNVKPSHRLLFDH